MLFCFLVYLVDVKVELTNLLVVNDIQTYFKFINN